MYGADGICTGVSGGLNREKVKQVILIGMTIKERYCILEQIGQGSEGCLYVAKDMETGKLWAVKRIPLSQKKEGRLLLQLHHPGLPEMVDYQEEGDCCWLVMEYVRGKSLGQWLREGRCFSVKEAVKIGMETAEVLDYLHSRKPPIYYSDLKPDNLMLDETDRLRLVDFGSAVIGYTENPRVCQGTIGYAAPEQYEGHVEKASDVYGLGRTLLALTGKKPAAVFLASPGFWAFLCRCCRHQAKRRFQDMGQVRDRLRKLEHRGRQRKERYLAAVAVLLLFSLAMAGYLQFYRRPDFYAALNEVTELYYQKEFQQKLQTPEEDICRKAEDGLQEMLKNYPEKEEQRRLLLLLACNGEAAGWPEHAALYYEQLLLYEPGYGEAYGKYGLFLLRMGQEEESQELWETYARRKSAGEVEPGESPALKQWQDRLKEWREQDQK